MQSKLDVTQLNSVQWFWYDAKTGQWNAYDNQTCAEIEKNFQQKIQKFSQTIGNNTYTIDFKKQSQINESNQTEQKIYRGESLWEWQDDTSWRGYPKEISNKLEQCVASQDQTPVEYNAPHGQRYQIYPLKNYQINIVSKKKRNIRKNPMAIMPVMANPTPAPDEQPKIWEFEDNDGWKQCSQPICQEINNAIKQGRSTVNVQIGINTYEINLDKKVQKNLATNKERRIRKLGENTLTFPQSPTFSQPPVSPLQSTPKTLDESEEEGGVVLPLWEESRGNLYIPSDQK